MSEIGKENIIVEKENKTKNFLKILLNGIIFENPTFVLMLGMCPTLAVTTSFTNAIGMGLSTTFVLIFSNLIISALKNIIPNRVRIPSYIVIVATLVTIVQLLMQGYFPDLYNSLGIYIPLIVVNCIILGRAESFASKHNPVESIADGIGIGVGFTVALSIISIIREFFGNGSFLNIQIIDNKYHIMLFVLAPGAFLVLAILTAIQNAFRIKKDKSVINCNNDCMRCGLRNKEEE